MNYSPKLKTAMERIKPILKEYDICATIVLHTPGFSEYLTKVDSAYSCAKFEGDFLRIKAKLQEDFDGDKDAWNEKVTDTVNMIQHFADVSANTSMSMYDLLDKLKESVEIETTRGNNSSHTTQNN